MMTSDPSLSVRYDLMTPAPHDEERACRRQAETAAKKPRVANPVFATV